MIRKRVGWWILVGTLAVAVVSFCAFLRFSFVSAKRTAIELLSGHPEMVFEGSQFSMSPDTEKSGLFPSWGFEFNSDERYLTNTLVVWIGLNGDYRFPEQAAEIKQAANRKQNERTSQP